MCRLSVSVLVVGGADHADRGVAPASVVDSFDPIADGELSSRLGRPQVTVKEPYFYCGPERFSLQQLSRVVNYT